MTGIRYLAFPSFGLQSRSARTFRRFAFAACVPDRVIGEMPENRARDLFDAPLGGCRSFADGIQPSHVWESIPERAGIIPGMEHAYVRRQTPKKGKRKKENGERWVAKDENLQCVIFCHPSFAIISCSPRIAAQVKPGFSSTWRKGNFKSFIVRCPLSTRQ
jgi:hypothetical protein